MNATQLIDTLKPILIMRKKDGLNQKDIAKEIGESQQMVSRLLFLAKADEQTLAMIRRASMSKTALSKLIDSTRMKTKASTLQTKLLMLKKLVSEYAEDKTLKKNKRSLLETKIDRNRLRLVQVTGENYQLRERKKQLEKENDRLREELLKLKFDLSLYQLSAKSGHDMDQLKPKKHLTPDQMYQIELVKSALGGVKVSIDGPRVMLDCMTEGYRDTTLERLALVSDR